MKGGERDWWAIGRDGGRRCASHCMKREGRADVGGGGRRRGERALYIKWALYCTKEEKELILYNSV